MKHEMACDPVAARDLKQIALGEERSVESFQGEKPVHEALGVTNANRLAYHSPSRDEKGGREQHRRWEFGREVRLSGHRGSILRAVETAVFWRAGSSLSLRSRAQERVKGSSLG